MTQWNPLRSWKAAFFALPPVLLLLAATGAPQIITPVKTPIQAVPADPTPPAAEWSPEPSLALTALPDPPRQNDPWTPPATTLPPEFVAATRTLFRQGLADPRGGEYREITIPAGGYWLGQVGPTRVHGWVLPRGAAGERTFAVCWNGQVYPVSSTGPPADLKADVAALVGHGPLTDSHMPPENEFLSETVFSPLKVSLLLRLDKPGLAEQLWMAQAPEMRAGDPYLRLAADWTWPLLWRTLGARLHGDDPLALFLMRRLTRIRARVEGEAAERHLPRLVEIDPGGMGSSENLPSKSRLVFLDALPALLADQEERARMPKHTPALQAGRSAFSSKRAYVAALIGDLNEVNSGGWANGSPTMADDSIVRALVDQGDDAVVPLIQVIATDRRLTRTVGWNMFGHGVHPAFVARAAYAAVVILLHTSAFGDGSYHQDDPPRTAAAIQAYWNKYKALPLPDRWYRTLADDRATPTQWQEAADAIVRPVNVTFLGDGGFSWMPQPGIVFPFSGEPLRTGYGADVARLMARRVPQIEAAGPFGPGTAALRVHNACLMALDLGRWDPRAAVPTLRTQTARLDFLESALAKRGDSLEPFGSQDREEMTLARVQGHDPSALTGYMGWLATQDPVSASAYPYRLFEPLWRFPHDPAVIAGAARLFNGPPSAWQPFVQKRQDYSDFGDVLHSPLLGLEAFQHSFLATLHDSTPLGTLIVGEHGRQGGYVTGLGRDTQDDFILDPFRPKTPRTLTVRRSDLYAWHLSRLAGMPRFELYWPQAKRDAVIAQAADRLRHYGPRFEYQESLDDLWKPESRDLYAPSLWYLWGPYGSSLAHLAFPRLTHPATLAEAAHGKAIFSLAGQGECRLMPLPHWPLAARWVTDRRYPQPGSDEHGKPGIMYQRDGLVWQAEEVRRSGKWQHFYGFVGPHDIVRVPAEQIEFPPDNPYRWMSYSPALDGNVFLPENSHRLPVGQPLPVTLILRCRSSRDQNIPTEWLQAGLGGPALRAGLTLKLSYSPGPSFPGLGGPEAEKRRVWTPLTPIRTASFAPTPAMQRLGPAQEMTALRLDLRDWYDLTRPGSYRLLFDFDGKRSGLGEGQGLSLWFELTK